jgi:uncharacterized membrane protein YphA (DoxX/SURF4 family)
MDASTCNRFALASSILVKGVNMHKGFDSRLEQAWWVLRIGLGVGPFLAGLDKYFNLLTNWTAYISPAALKILPFSGQTFMHLVGVIEMIVGLAILTKWTRLSSYVASAWLLAIAINLVSTGMFFDVAVRDVEMALAAFVLARMTEVRSNALKSEVQHEPSANTVVAA